VYYEYAITKEVISIQNSQAGEKSLQPQKAWVKKDVKSEVVAKKWR